MPLTTHAYADLLLEHMPVQGALYAAQDLRLLDANTRYLDAMERFIDPALPRGWVINRPLSEWMPSTLNGAELLATFRHVITTGTAYRAEAQAFVTSAGTVTYWNWTLDPIFDTDHHIAYLLHAANEVTEQVLAAQRAEMEQALLYQSNVALTLTCQWQEVVEQIAHGVRASLDIQHIGRVTVESIQTHFHPVSASVHVANPERRVLSLLYAHVPPGSEEVLGELQYLPYDAMPFIDSLDHLREPFIEEDLQVAAKAGRVSTGTQALERGIRGFICIPLWFRDQFEGILVALFDTPIATDGPQVRAFKGSGTHIAAALAQARLHSIAENERTRLQTLLEVLPEGILLVESSHGTITYANPAAARFFAIPSAEMIGTSLSAYPRTHRSNEVWLNGRQIDAWPDLAQRVLAGATLHDQETLITRPDGSFAVMLASSTSLLRQHGTVSEIAILLRDITAQMTLEQHKNEFFWMLNHELRTPITIIQGFSEILRLKAEQDQRLDTLTLSFLSNIFEQSAHLTRLISEMLDISQLEHGQLVLSYAPHDLLQTLMNVIENQAVTTSTHQLHLVLDNVQPDGTLMGSFDEERIIQVLCNLLSNAIKYSPAGGEIEIGLRYDPEQASHALIWIKDHGIGIPSDEMPNIFKRFYRARALDRALSGLGIGLYLVKEIVTCHGGRVWVESTVGIGSTFYIELPLRTPEGHTLHTALV